MTGTTTIGHHQHTAYNRNNPVPYSWQTGGPITLAGDRMAVSHYIETQTGWSIKKFVRTARRCRTVKIKAGNHALTAADPLPDDLRAALLKIRADGAH